MHLAREGVVQAVDSCERHPASPILWIGPADLVPLPLRTRSMPSQEVFSKVRTFIRKDASPLLELTKVLDSTQPDGAVFTTSQGHPVAEPYAHQRAGRNGPLLLQDFAHIDMLAHFDRERIPERVVHAKGGGAHGVFEVTDPIPDLTCSEFLGKKGKVSATARFSTVGGESGSADTARDPRGFSVKLRTEEGIWDHVYVRPFSCPALQIT